MRSTNYHYAPSARSESQALITNSKSPAILFAVIAAVAFESTLAPTINNNFIPHLDKVVHFFTFGLIAWLLGVMISQLTFSLSSGECRWRQRISPGGPLTVILTSFTLVTLLGSANEWIQSFTPGRLATVFDVLADMAGAIVFLVVWKIR